MKLDCHSCSRPMCFRRDYHKAHIPALFRPTRASSFVSSKHLRRKASRIVRIPPKRELNKVHATNGDQPDFKNNIQKIVRSFDDDFPRPEKQNRKKETALEKQQRRFVEFFRRASPYVETHRESIFVLIIPGTVVEDDSRLKSMLRDIALIHQLGVHVVLVIGSTLEIDRRLEDRGLHPKFVGEYRVTDTTAMQAAMEAAGKNTVKVLAQLSKDPPVLQLRRQGIPDRLHKNISVRAASGNFVIAKRRGVVGGVDFLETGEVRFVDTQGVLDQLRLNNVVVMSNLGYTSTGHVLNCHTHEVATVTAMQLKADKVVCVMGSETSKMLRQVTGDQKAISLASAEQLLHQTVREFQQREGQRDSNGQVSSSSQTSWYIEGCPVELCTAVAVCRGGVKRAHIVDSAVEGSLLLELYTRDGLGTMIFSDDYEVTRPATMEDLDSLARMLAPLETEGICRKRDREQLIQELPNFMVMERSGKVLGCAALTPYSRQRTAEVAAFAVHPAYRGLGRGDRLLESLESEARRRFPGIRSLFLLTTRTMDWFTQRGYLPVGPAHQSGLLPEGKEVDTARNAQMGFKVLEDEDLR